jgi:hypothetical protein
MATVTDVNQSLNELDAAVAVIANEVVNLKASGGVATQAELDAINTHIQSATAAITAAE